MVLLGFGIDDRNFQSNYKCMVGVVVSVWVGVVISVWVGVVISVWGGGLPYRRAREHRDEGC